MAKKAEDVTDTLQLALAASGCDSARVVHKPRLLSDKWIELHLDRARRMARRQWHGSCPRRKKASADPRQARTVAPDLENRILLESYDLPGDPEGAVHRFVERYNHANDHECPGSLTPALDTG